MIKKETTTCKICGAPTTLLDDAQIHVTYACCNTCGFIYKNTQHHLNKALEYKEYLNHNNSFESKGYVLMFENLIQDFITPLHISGKALDYGSGPGPVLKELLRRAGYEVFDYDPFFHPDKSYLENTYDLITCTEVVEHFYNPWPEFRHLVSLLSDTGYLVLMTKFNPSDNETFLKSSYRREKSHVSFYALETLHYIAEKLHLEVVTHNDRNVIVFKKLLV